MSSESIYFVKRDVALFHVVTDTPVLTVPQWPSEERVFLRQDLIEEEVGKELSRAIEERDLVATADAIIDSILWDEVQRSNMSKTVPLTDGSRGVLKRGDGKVLKPPGWTPPDIEGVLRKHGWEG